VFVGRSHELSRLAELLERARAGNGNFALVSGEAGIGKTRLAEEATRTAEALGFACAWGRSWEGSDTPAYWPWTQLLRQLKRLPDYASALEAKELESILDPRVAPLPASDAEQARFTLFESVTAALQTATDRRPALLVLDDVQAADAATLQLLRFVARSLNGCRVLLLGTSRDVASSADTDATRLLTQVAREARHFPLARLNAEDVGAWVARASVTLTADNVWRVSEGNPLFVEELLATAKKYPDAAHLSGELPRGVREAIQQHLQLVSPRARSLLEAASVLGREPTLDVLRALLAVDSVALREALASGIVRDIGEDRLRFSHILLRDELYASLDPERRAALHRAAATVAGQGRSLVAHHALEGSRAADASLTLDLVLAAMREASGRLAHEDSARLGRRALERLEPWLEPPRVCELLVDITEALVLAGDIEASQRIAERAATLASELGRSELLARAVLARATEIPFSGDPVATRWLRRALAIFPAQDSPRRVELMARLATSLTNQPGGLVEQPKLLTEAVALARRVGDERALLTALHNAAGSFPDRLTPRERFALYAETVDLAEATGTVGSVAPLLAWHVVSWLELFEPERALTALERVERLLAPYTRPHYRWRAPLMRAHLYALAGRFAEAEKQARESLEISRSHGIVEGMTMYAIHLSCLAYLRGDAQGLESRLAEVQSIVFALPLSEIFRSMWEAPLGDSELVRRSFELVKAMNPEQIPGVAHLGWPCVAAGLSEYAEMFYQLGLGIPKTTVLALAPGGFGCMGPVALMMGKLALMTGRRQEAASHLERAAKHARELKSPPLVAQCELAWAEALSELDRAAAAEHASLALEAARSVGLEATATRAQALLGSSPLRPLARDPRERELRLRREGDVWLLELDARRLQLQHAKGLAYLATLVASPHRPIHALELSGSDERGDAGPLLDARARQSYRARAAELQRELDEASSFNDQGRVERLRSELDAIGDELARAFGLGGRARQQGSATERARINVQRRLRDVIKRVTEQDSALGRHLALSLKTGNFCIYSPTWPAD
jgi:hypothetical protein